MDRGREVRRSGIEAKMYRREEMEGQVIESAVGERSRSVHVLLLWRKR